ncbi:MAG: DUF4350 domain-containing protein [Candidatus Hermodarchaeota archaeon]
MLTNRALILVIILFLLFTAPFAIALLTPRTYNFTPFSIYNESWDGASGFRQIFEEAGANVETIISSTNALNRLNETPPDIFVILGPALHYDFSESLALLIYLLKGGRVLIADDFGTGNDILSLVSTLLSAIGSMTENMTTNLFGFSQADWSQSLSNEGQNTSIAFPTPIGIRFNGSVLIDTENHLDSPVQPILRTGVTETTFVPPWASVLTTGVSQVLCNYATSISWKLRYHDFDENVTKEQWFPFGNMKAAIEGVIRYDFQLATLVSSANSWLESNVTQAQYGNYYPDSSEWGGVRFPVFAFLPLGPLDSPVSPMIGICSDPSMFINGIMDNTNFNNRRFAQNIASYMLAGRPEASVIFDEAHLRHAPVSPLLTLGTYLRFLDLISMFPLFAPLLPLIVISYGRRYLPKKTESKPILFAKEEKLYGRSFFAAKMRQFLQTRDYRKALELIYRRTRRQILRKTRHTKFTPEIGAEYLISQFSSTFGDFEALKEKFIDLDKMTRSRLQVGEQYFIKQYLFLKKISDALVGVTTYSSKLGSVSPGVDKSEAPPTNIVKKTIHVIKDLIKR